MSSDNTMDEYGIGSSAIVGLRLFEMSARRSGRTERMISMAGDDDIIVCLDGKEAQRVERLLRAKGKKTRVTHREPTLASLAYIRPAVAGRCLPDHGWVYEYFVRAMRAAEADLAGVRRIVGRGKPDMSAPSAAAMNISRIYID